MTTVTLRADATASTRATVYQLCLAVDKCYELKPGQRLLVEELGDVTVEGRQQLEVKVYSDVLTDGHPNFWNSLTNWLDPKFLSASYESLILWTTQPFSDAGTLKSWNTSNSTQRLSILVEINKGFETSAIKLAKDANYKPSKTLKQQRAMLHSSRKAALLAIVDKIVIEASQLSSSALYEKILFERSIGVLQKNKHAFINALFGFVCRLGKSTDTSWSITYEEFDQECQNLIRTYSRESREFPTAHFDDFDEQAIDVNREDLFMIKIRDIDHCEFLPQAIRAYEATVTTIATEFSKYSVQAKHLVSFKTNVENILKLRYKSASRTSPGCIASSQAFYADMVTCEPPAFQGYDDRFMWFRNGLLHMCMNDESKTHQWKLT
jgi:hypothetical protein